MKIALINEKSQAVKNSIILEELCSEATKRNHLVHNYGMYSQDQDHQINYVQVGLITSILLTTKAVDFVVTGCGTGQGAMLACNSFPNVLCGYITSPFDAYLFAQVNDGNAIAIPFGQNFGWASEVNLRYTFEKLFSEPFGTGYPKHRVEYQQIAKNSLDDLKQITHRSLIEILKKIDQQFLLDTINYPEFKELFFANAQDCEEVEYIKQLLA